MSKKLGVLVLFLLIVLLVNNVYAQNLEEGVGNVKEKAQEVSEFTEKEKWDFLGERWKEYLLESGPVSRMDELFTKLNPLFIVFFARNYSFSLVMLFVFMLWLFTFLALPGYFIFLENENYKWLAGLAGTVLLAHLQIFNFVAKGMQKVLLYEYSFGWKIAITVLLFLGLFVYLYLNKYFAGMVNKAKEANKKRGMEFRVEKIEKYQEGLKKGSDA